MTADAGTPLGTPSEPGDSDRLRVSTRHENEIRRRLGRWLGTQLPGSSPEVIGLERPATNGMSSDTVLFDAAWRQGGARVERRLVARLEPAADAYPIFETYDLAAQVRVMRLVRERSAVPVPAVRWFEPDGRPLGTPFFVMDRVEGSVPPDVMPYTMGSWVSEASDQQRAALQAASVELVASIHAVPATPEELAFLDAGGAGDTALRRHVAAQRRYYDWARQGARFPVLERAFDWLDAHWPTRADAEPPVLCWGDARIGNVVYRDFTPAGVLDWEMATLGPRELDVGWMVFLHRFFQDLTEELGMPGLPTFLDRRDVAAQYATRSGHVPRDLDWFIVYAALRHGIVMSRAMGRRVRFGELEAPAQPEDLVMHRRSIDRLVEGTYWDRG